MFLKLRNFSFKNVHFVFRKRKLLDLRAIVVHCSDLELFSSKFTDYSLLCSKSLRIGCVNFLDGTLGFIIKVLKIIVFIHFLFQLQPLVCRNSNWSGSDNVIMHFLVSKLGILSLWIIRSSCQCSVSSKVSLFFNPLAFSV